MDSTFYNRNRAKIVSYVVFVVYALAMIIGTANHEMWRDETRVWLLGTEANSIHELHNNLRNEGHPRLIHYICYFILGRMSDDVRTFQYFHLLLVLVAGGLVAFSKLPLYLKPLLLLSYYMFFEYTLICRAYVICLIGLWLFCTIWPKRNTRWGLATMAASVFLMTQSSLFGVILGGFGTLVYLCDWGRTRKEYKATICFSLAALVFAGLSLFQIYPRDQSIGGRGVVLSATGILNALSLIPRAVLPFGFRPTPYWWNTDFFVTLWLPGILGMAMVCFLIWLYWESKHILLATCWGMGILLLFSFVFPIASARHYGHIFLLLVAAAWLFEYETETTHVRKSVHRIYLAAVLSISAFFGIHAYIRDYRMAFSGAQGTAEFLQGNYPNALYLQDIYFTGEPICAYMNRPMVFLALRKKTKLFPWDGVSGVKPCSRETVESSAVYAAMNQSLPVLLVLNYEHSFSKESLEKVAVESVYESPRTIVPSEHYYVYKCTPRPKQ